MQFSRSVERGGSVRSFHVDSTRKEDVLPIVRANVIREAHIMTDEAIQYAKLGDEFSPSTTRLTMAARNGDIRIAGRARKSTRTRSKASTAIFKRGMKGVYQHCSEKHLHRYLAEFDFRYSNCVKLGVDDIERADRALRGATGTPHLSNNS